MDFQAVESKLPKNEMRPLVNFRPHFSATRLRVSGITSAVE
jgi:hypothetical protein